MHTDLSGSALEITLLALQALQVVILWTHDWIPLGRLNDVSAVRSQDTTQRLVVVTLMQSIPWTIGLFLSASYFGHSYPSWVRYWLWVSYAVLFLGELRAWWLPYLFRAEPPRAARYKIMFGNTHTFFPQRNGMAPNTLHVVLHSLTAATLIALFMAEVRS